MSEHFDPSEQETKELLPKNESDMSDYTEDTNADPEGAEKRSARADIQLPDYWYKKYALDDFGKPTFNASVVNSVMEVFDLKYGTPMNFVEGDASVEDQRIYFDHQVNDVVSGMRQLLEVDPQSTGLNFLQLTTRTWSEFVSICYEYSDSMSNFKEDDIPDWLIQREEKMLQLGRKARILSAALEAIDEDFGLKDTKIQRNRVQAAVEQRMQRLAEWNFNRQADMSGKAKREMNAETLAHMESIISNA